MHLTQRLGIDQMSAIATAWTWVSGYSPTQQHTHLAAISNSPLRVLPVACSIRPIPAAHRC